MPENEKSIKKSFFIGANTSHGFVRCADDVFEGLDRIYVIKGGPGCGKSTFMKRVAEQIEKSGARVERYFCSSDESSLDGIASLSLGIGMIDGTSPHVYEAKYLGAKEIYLDFSELLNAGFLSQLKETVKSCADLKSECYASAYKYLYIAEHLREEKEKLLYTCYDAKKADKAAERLMKPLGRGEGHILRRRQISSLSMNGESYLDTYEKMSDQVWNVSDLRGAYPFFIYNVLEKARSKDLKTDISYDYLGRPNALYFPERSVCITYNRDGADKNINTERFIVKEKLRETRRRLRFLSSVEKELVDGAKDSLKMAKEHHFKLESIYSEAMDFEALNKMTEAFIKDKI